ncbi:hypothetical protein RB653_009958 [Dictyostelium firmibasis]|uniref:Pleckstrin domain-containing protein n=1 Tax=Dictyostelium firmibasis TaxID=79012 RepID=A0AAN7TSF3_9MYCE
MEQYEDKSGQLLVQINQLSDTRSKKVLQGFVKDVMNYEKSNFEKNNQFTDSESEENDSKPLAISLYKHNISPTYFLDLCNKHIINSELANQPSILWKIVEYIISELDYLDRILDSHQEKKENTKLLSSTSIRLEEISYLLSYIQSSPKMHTGEYSELLVGINGHMKKITLKLKNNLEEDQYSNCVKYGWIEKRCGKNQSFSSWKRMWFILKDSKLIYYIKEKNLKKRSSTIGSAQEFYKQNGTDNNINNNCTNNTYEVIHSSSIPIPHTSTSTPILSTTSTNNTDSVNIVHLEGELGKKKEGKGWKVRWMKLLDHSLVYYKSAKDKEPLGIINLNECQDCEVNKETSNKFVVVHPNNRYYFKTNTKQELTLWVKSVKSRIPSINQTKMDLDQFQLKGVIEFNSIQQIAENFKFGSQPNCLTITTDEKAYYLSFDSNKEKLDWLNQMNLSINKFKGGNPLNSSNGVSSNSSPTSLQSQQAKEGGSLSPNILGNFKSSLKPWRFSSSPSQGRISIGGGGSGDRSSTQVKFVDNPLSSSKGTKEEFDGGEYGSQILPRKSTIIGPNGGVKVSSTSGAVELSPVLISNGSGINNNNNNTTISSSGNSIPTCLSDLINESSDNEDGDDLKMMIPESLKNEMMRRSALSLLKTFKLEIFIWSNHQEVFTFLFSDSVLVDQVKAFAFKKIPSLANLSVLDYRLGIDEDTLLEVEFLKFIYSHTMVELALKTCGIVKIGIFHHRKDRRVKEKLYSDKFYGHLFSQSPDGRKGGNGVGVSGNGIPIEYSRSEPNLQYCLSSSPSSKETMVPSSPSSHQLITPPKQQQQQPEPEQSQPEPQPQPEPESEIELEQQPIEESSIISTTPIPIHSNSILSTSPSSTPSTPSTPVIERQQRQQMNSAWHSVNPSITLNQRRQLISSCPGWNIEVSSPTSTFTGQGFKPKFDKQEHGFYRRYNFDGTSTVQSFLGVDMKMGPLAFSLAKDSNDNYRGVLHTKHGAKTISEEAKNMVGVLNLLSLSKKVKTKKVVSHLVGLLDPTIDAKLLNLASNQSELQKELLSFEERQTTSGFKFGMVYCRHGQVTDDEIFSNKQGSPEWDEFLSLIGDKIELVGWPHYSAGLDVKFNSTGTHSLYTDYHGNEVMFHVSTMLPFSTTDHQQIERKRQVGNDICVVIFNDGTLSYMPNTITSQFNHVIILVQYDKQNNGYKVSMACKDGVKSPFEPLSPNNLIKKSDIKDFLLTKLINGELASLQAPVFASKITRTRESLLNYYISQFL